MPLPPPRSLILAVTLGFSQLPQPVMAQAGAVAPVEFKERRVKALAVLGRDILLLRSRSSGAGSAEPAFRQDPNFYYFTGLASSLGAVLALDGERKESWLFVPDSVPGFLGWIARDQPSAVDSVRNRLAVDHVVPLRELEPYLNGRLSESGVAIRIDAGGLKSELFGRLPSPFDLQPLENPFELWRYGLVSRWGDGRVRNDSSVIHGLRRIKSLAEVAIMRRVARASSGALRAGVAGISAGKQQRHVESEVAGACFLNNGSGPSFWPWVMSGENSVYPGPWSAVTDYNRLDRLMKAGELVRLDVGCEVDHYMGDVGRTIPVSGRFDAGQRESWDLLIRAYHAGLMTIRDGARVADVIAAGLEEVRRSQGGLRTPLGRKSAAAILAPGGDRYWYVHGLGLTTDEDLGDTLRAGMVLAWEPIFSVDGQGFYLEDMILVTFDGYEILTANLPYTADELEAYIVLQRSQQGAK